VFVVPVLLLLMAVRDLFIVALFDTSFLGISGVLAVSLVAEVPRFAAYALGSAMLPAGLVRPWLVSSVVSTALRLAVGLPLLPWIGLYAFAVSTVVQWVVVLVYTAWVMRSRMSWRPDARLAWLILLGTAVVAAAAAVSTATAWGELLLPVVAVAWGWRLGRREIAQIVAAFVARVRRPRAA
jgi:O-antigen/teichoic acid export membrane protein